LSLRSLDRFAFARDYKSDATRSNIAYGALAWSSVPMSAAASESAVAPTRLSTCSTEVALAIGAVTPGLAIAQASATSAGLALCTAAT
jgi:hypothetical protein